MDKTFSLDKTNPRLTGNIKCVFDNEENIFLESINSTEYASQSFYKGFSFNENLKWGVNLRNFASMWDSNDSIFDPVDEVLLNKNDDINNTYHQLYHKGVRSDQKSIISGNLRYFAPINIGNKKDLPDAFVIFKIPNNEPNNLDYNNKYSEWINNGKVHKVFDLSKIKNNVFSGAENSYVQFDYEDSIYAKGINLKNGLPKKALETTGDEFLNNEVTLTEWENDITNIYKRNQMVYGSIFNMEFSFEGAKTNNFERYVGFYVKYNELDFDTLRKYKNTGAIRLLKEQNSIREFKNEDQENEYFRTTTNKVATVPKTKRKSLIRFRLMLNPNIGDVFKIVDPNGIEHKIKFDHKTIGSNIPNTQNKIIEDINNNYGGAYNSITAEKDGKWVKLYVNSSSNPDEENIYLEVENYVKVEEPLWGEVSSNHFISVDKNSVLFDNFIDPNVFGSYLKYEDKNGIPKTSKIKNVFNYENVYLYKLENEITNAENIETFWFMNKDGDIPILCSLLENREMDVRQTFSDYENVYDFDIEQFRISLLKEINEGVGLKGVLDYFDVESYSEINQEQLTEYKENLKEIVESYFEDIEYKENTLIKNIDINTSESELVPNEYDRLDEYNNEFLNIINRLYTIINKWSLSEGNDVYHNPYRLNIALPFGLDNYSTNQMFDGRDIRFNTHSWYIIGDGVPFYLKNKDNKSKLSYSKNPLNENILLDNEIDAYDFLEHKTEDSVEKSYSYIEYDSVQNKSFSFFKGLKWYFEDETLDGYKFSVILSGSKRIQEETYEMEILKNDHFKTMTIVIWFYAPDIVLTSLEKGVERYNLDRSMLYYSKNVSNTLGEDVYFGETDISLNLYDTNETKYYTGLPVTQNWFYEKPNGEHIIWVGRGNGNVFNTPFNNILGLNDDLTIYFSDSENINSPNYGMYIVFEDMAEVSENYFWCRRIIVKKNTNYDPDGENLDDYSDNIVDDTYNYNVLQEYLSDNNVFNTNNAIYSSKSIARDNSKYNKILTNTSNIVRYEQLTLPKIKNKLKEKPLSIKNSKKKIFTNVVEPTQQNVSIKLKHDLQNGFSLLNTPYIFTIKRYNGEFKINTKTIYKPIDSEDADSVFIKDFSVPIYEKLNIIENSSDSLVNNIKRTSEYKQHNIHQKSKGIYYIFKETNNETPNEKQIGWIYNPIEYIGEPSLVFDGIEKISFKVQYSGEELLFSEFMYEKVYKWLKLNDYVLDDTENIQFISIENNVNQETLDNYSIKKIIVDNFIKNTFLNIYKIKTITDEEGNVVNWDRNSDGIVLENSGEGVYEIVFGKGGS